MNHPIFFFFAYTALFEVIADGKPNLLVEEMLCSSVTYPIHDDAQDIFEQVRMPTESGTYQLWATGTVVSQTRRGEACPPHAEVRKASISLAPPECIQALVAAARQQRAESGPQIEVYNEHEASVIANVLGAPR